jgi:hypothetical protein
MSDTTGVLGSAQRLHDALHAIDIDPNTLPPTELAFLGTIIGQGSDSTQALMDLLNRAHQTGNARGWREFRNRS